MVYLLGSLVCVPPDRCCPTRLVDETLVAGLIGHHHEVEAFVLAMIGAVTALVTIGGVTALVTIGGVTALGQARTDVRAGVGGMTGGMTDGMAGETNDGMTGGTTGGMLGGTTGGTTGGMTGAMTTLMTGHETEAGTTGLGRDLTTGGGNGIHHRGILTGMTTAAGDAGQNHHSADAMVRGGLMPATEGVRLGSPQKPTIGDFILQSLPARELRRRCWLAA